MGAATNNHQPTTDEDTRLLEIDRAHALIEEGADQLARGDTVSGDDFFNEWDADLDTLEEAQHLRTR